MKIFISYKEEPNVYFMSNMPPEYVVKFPMKMWVTNPFTKEQTTIVFKKLIKQQMGAVFVEMREAGKVRGG